MLRLGTTPRNRWTKNGSTATRQSCVHPNLAAFISNERRTDAALQALVESGAISFDTVNGHKTYKIRPRLMEETVAKLEPDCIKFWKQQALLVLYHAITWKYIEPRLSKKEIPWLKDEHAVGTADPNDLRTHAANGLTALQDCLDEMQREAFSKAEEVLDGWEPISKQPMVQVVLFRKYCLLGQIKRQQGLFPQAVQAVETALKIANEHTII
ncbi:hypothetical protein K4K59_011166 [Colletotrichum sp. SAR11_240]|nr:hypothetical protein K4K59_011166 [Colletotrichum sp. SAR11_240]